MKLTLKSVLAELFGKQLSDDPELTGGPDAGHGIPEKPGSNHNIDGQDLSVNPAHKEYDIPPKDNLPNARGPDKVANPFELSIPVGVPMPKFGGGRNPGMRKGFMKK